MMERRRLLLNLIRGDNVKIKTGFFTVNSYTRGQDITINHNLGEIPQIFIIDTPDFDISSSHGADVIYGAYYNLYSSHVPDNADMTTMYFTGASATTPTYTNLSSSNPGRVNFISALSNNSCCAIAYNNNYQYAPGIVYRWVAICGIEIN